MGRSWQSDSRRVAIMGLWSDNTPKRLTQQFGPVLTIYHFKDTFNRKTKNIAPKKDMILKLFAVPVSSGI
jgi:hypothetical protein